MRAGGRLIYVGAGTSGRLAQVDAIECVPTFNLPEGTVMAIVAGGRESLERSTEEAEDDGGAGAAAVTACQDRFAGRGCWDQRQRTDPLRGRRVTCRSRTWRG